MSSATDTRLRGRTRWSLAARCPRLAVYAYRGTQQAEPSERTKRIWRRGRQLGAAVADDLEAKYGPDEIERERAVPWPDTGMPLGELHTDVHVRRDRLAVEVKSTGHPAGLMDSAILQLGGEILFDQDADQGCLAIADPTGWNETQLIPVVLTADLEEKVRDVADQVATAISSDVLPDRVCGKPADGHGRWCPFVDVCFDGWQPPDPGRLPADAALLALELHQAQQEERAARVQAAEVETRRRELAQRLAEYELAPGVEYAGAGVRVTLTRVADSERLSLATVKKAGAWTPEVAASLDAYVTLSGGHDRWKVVRDPSAPVSAGDFGERVPWDDPEEDGR